MPEPVSFLCALGGLKALMASGGASAGAATGGTATTATVVTGTAIGGAAVVGTGVKAAQYGLKACESKKN